MTGGSPRIVQCVVSVEDRTCENVLILCTIIRNTWCACINACTTFKKCNYTLDLSTVCFDSLSRLSNFIRQSIRRSIKTSETHRNKCKLSMATLLNGMVGNNGGLDILYFLLLCGSWDTATFSAIVREPLSAGSSKDHCLEVSHWAAAGHLHQMHT